MRHAPGRGEFGFDVGQMKVLRLLKPAFHVAEAILIGHELDVPVLAIGIQRQDLFRRQGRCMPPNFLGAPDRRMYAPYKAGTD